LVVEFSKLNLSERPLLTVTNASGVTLGVIACPTDLTFGLKYNETSTMNFTVPYMIDGEVVPIYEKLASRQVISFPGIGQFIIVNPSEVDDGIQRYMNCEAYSLEYEFTYKKITIQNGTYKFWDETSPDETVLGMIMELMPSWSVRTVPSSIANKYRTFEIENENLYNFMKGTLQLTYECIFEFDTVNRTVSVRDTQGSPVSKPVFLSNKNLVSELEISENTEDIVTRLDVNGAEGVDIRDVNPTGTNRMIDLSHYMTEDNFTPELIAKYNVWKQHCEDVSEEYFNLSVQYALKVSQLTTEQAKLADYKEILDTYTTLQGVSAQAAAQSIKGAKEALVKYTNLVADAAEEMARKQTAVDAIDAEREQLFARITEMVNDCRFDTIYDSETGESSDRFTAEEYKMLDRYIIDGEIEDSTFVVEEVESYDSQDQSANFDSLVIGITGAEVTAYAEDLYMIRGGKMTMVADGSYADIVTAVIDWKDDDTFIATAHLSKGKIAGSTIDEGCITFTGHGSAISSTETTVDMTVTDAYRYFTYTPSEFQRRSVAWELYNYGKDVLSKLCRPSYTFNVSSANFLALEDFVSFKNKLELGQGVYLDTAMDGVLEPICIGVSFEWFKPASLQLEFSDSYVSGDKTFRLVDLLEKSITMGKTVDSSKYAYSAFIDSGASSNLRSLQESALDVSKNAIMSSSGQTITWDGSGMRFRKRTGSVTVQYDSGNTDKTPEEIAADAAYADQYVGDIAGGTVGDDSEYDNEQIWINNNSIVMTADGWQTAEMAIGKFYDSTLGECWGIAAPKIVGTLIAGSSLIIQSEKKDGGIAEFIVDEDGCRLYNSFMTIANSTREILLNPDIGIAIGTPGIYTVDEETGDMVFDTDHANFWVDEDGNVYLRGAITATALTIVGSDSSETSMDDYLSNALSNYDDGNSVNEALAQLQNILNSAGGDIDQISGLINELNNELQATSSQATHIFYGNDDKSTANVGDIWYDTANGYVYRFVDYWTELHNQNTKDWFDAIANEDAIADEKIAVVRGENEPSSKSVGDIWDDGEATTPKVWDGQSWSDSVDRCFEEFIAAMTDYSSDIIKMYIDKTSPDDAEDGDVWYDTSAKVLKVISSPYALIENKALALILKYVDRDMFEQNGVSTRRFYVMPTRPSSYLGSIWIDPEDVGSLSRVVTFSRARYWDSIDEEYKYYNPAWRGILSASDELANAYRSMTVEERTEVDESVSDLVTLFGSGMNIVYYVNNINSDESDSIPDGSIVCEWSNIGEDRIYRKLSKWQENSDEGVANTANVIRANMDTSRGYVNVYPRSQQPSSASNGDVVYDTGDDSLYIWINGEFVKQYGRVADDLSYIRNVITETGATVYYCDSDPKQGNTLVIGDIWYNISNKRVKRYDRENDWQDITSSVQSEAIGAATQAKSAADNVANGSSGMSFTIGNNSSAIVQINSNVGFKAATDDGAYFQVGRVEVLDEYHTTTYEYRMGFYESNGDPLFYYSDGKMRFPGEDRISLGLLDGNGLSAGDNTDGCAPGCGYYMENGHRVFVAVNVKSTSRISAPARVNSAPIPSAYRPPRRRYATGICSGNGDSIRGYVDTSGYIYITYSSSTFDWCDLVIDYVI